MQYVNERERTICYRKKQADTTVLLLTMNFDIALSK